MCFPRWPALAASVLIFAIGCGDGSSGPSSADPTDGPTADLSEEFTGGNGPFVGEAAAPAGTGFEQREYVASGIATSYRPPETLTEDGRWTFESDGTAPYRTRVLVRRPTDASAFSGTTVVEWLNVSGGIDANPDYTSLEEELLRQGHAWVGVSAQLIGIEGGPVIVVAPGAEGLAGEGLKNIDPARYGSLAHPGDGYAFDIFTQVARALRTGAGLGGLTPRQILAAGESQSAMALVTYYNGVQPLERAFDGFFVHSRASVGLPVVGPGEFADLARGLGGTPVILRTDLSTPVIALQAEGDVVGLLNSVVARQPDSSTFRLWEVAGTAHADAHLLGPIADLLDCGVAVNDAPFHVVAKAALRGLDTWVRTGEAPVAAPRLDVSADDPPALVRDANAIATGGIRTPPVEVPVDVLSGVPGPRADVICLLLGSTTPLPDERLAELYDSRAEYEQQYRTATDDVIARGFALEEDRDALLGFASPSRIPE